MDLEQIYREQYRPLVGFLVRRIGDPARAEELAQEAFVRAIRKKPTQPRAWLYAVAANLARDEGRRRALAGRHLRLVEEPEPESPPDPEQELAAADRARLVRAALGRLEPRDREALLLKQEGASYPEIAEALGLAVGSVGTTLSRARRRLLEAWERVREEGENVAR